MTWHQKGDTWRVGGFWRWRVGVGWVDCGRRSTLRNAPPNFCNEVQELKTQEKGAMSLDGGGGLTMVCMIV